MSVHSVKDGEGEWDFQNIPRLVRGDAADLRGVDDHFLMEAVQAEIRADLVNVSSVGSELPEGGAVGSVLVITCFLGNESDTDWDDAQ